MERSLLEFKLEGLEWRRRSLELRSLVWLHRREDLVNIPTTFFRECIFLRGLCLIVVFCNFSHTSIQRNRERQRMGEKKRVRVRYRNRKKWNFLLRKRRKKTHWEILNYFLFFFNPISFSDKISDSTFVPFLVYSINSSLFNKKPKFKHGQPFGEPKAQSSLSSISSTTKIPVLLTLRRNLSQDPKVMVDNDLSRTQILRAEWVQVVAAVLVAGRGTGAVWTVVFVFVIIVIALIEWELVVVIVKVKIYW